MDGHVDGHGIGHRNGHDYGWSCGPSCVPVFCRGFVRVIKIGAAKYGPSCDWSQNFGRDRGSKWSCVGRS